MKKVLTRSFLMWIGIAILFVVISIFFTWPLTLNLSNGIIGRSASGDGPFFVWNMWWMNFAIHDFKQIVSSSIVYVPQEPNLTLHTLTFTNNIISLVLQRFLSYVQILNILQIFSFVIGALGMTFLVKRFTSRYFPAIVAGFIFSFNPYVFGHLLAGHYNLTMIYLIPWAIYFFFDLLEEDNNFSKFMFPLILAAQGYLDLQTLFCLMLILIIIFIYKIFFHKKSLSPIWIINLTVSISIFILTFLLPYLLWLGGSVDNIPPHKEVFAGDLKIIFSSNPLSPYASYSSKHLLNSLVGSYRENSIALGLMSIVASSASFLSRRNFRIKSLFLIIAVIGIILSMGNNLVFAGIYFPNIQLPFYYLSNLPFLNIGVVATRFILMSYFAVAILVALTIDDLMHVIKWRVFKIVIPFIIFSACIFEYYSGVMPINSMNASEFFYNVKNESGDFAVMPWNPIAKDMFLQTIHQKRMVGGALGRRVDDFYKKYYLDIPVIRRIESGDLENIQNDDLNKSTLNDFISKNKIRYIYINKESRTQESLSKIKIYLANFNLPIFFEDEQVIVYRFD